MRLFKSVGLALCLALHSVAVLAGTPQAALEAYLPQNTVDLVTDLDVAARFTQDGKAVLSRRGAKGQGRIYLTDPHTGQSRELADEVSLRPLLSGVTVEGVAQVRPLDYDPERDTLKFAAAGREWLLNRKTGVVTGEPVPPGPSEGVVSPDGRYRVIARNHNLYVVNAATGQETVLTADGTYDRRYGQNYPLLGRMAAANSETPDLPVFAHWSKDAKLILTYRMERNGSHIWQTVQHNPPGSRFPRSFAHVYPTAGAKDVPLIHPVILDVEAALKGEPAVREPDLPPNPLLWPGEPNMHWDENGQIVYHWTRRGYGEIAIYEADPQTLKATLRAREAGTPMIMVTSSGVRAAPELGGYLVISERSGWAQLYHVKRGDDPDGGKALTKGEWEVRDIHHVAKDGWLLVEGNGREAGVNPYFRSLYRVGLDGGIVNLTPEPLDHEINVSPGGEWFIDRMSSPVHPTETLLRRTSDGAVLARLGQADPSRLLATGFTPPEVFETLADDGKTKLYGVIYRPKHFDPAKSWPVIENVYTGPTTHRFAETWGSNIVSGVNAVAQLGAVVVIIDGRGTSQRGKAFRASAVRNAGEVGLDDHIHVLKAMKAKYPYLDLERVGVYGGSAGGYDAARFVLRRPDFYKVAVASSGNHDLRLDKAWWPETFMGLADDATWEANSNIPQAKNLKGHLMLVHGDLDDNVPVTASLRLSQALTREGKPHELVILPNTGHNVAQPYYWHRLSDFFLTHLIGTQE